MTWPRTSAPPPPQVDEEQCPVTGFTTGAFDYTMPPELREIFRSASAMSGAPGAAEGADLDAAALKTLAARLWTTLLVLAVATNATESFLLKTENSDGVDETIVCRAMAWVDFVAERFPQLRPRLDSLFARAEAVTAAWEARNRLQVTRSREAWNRQADVRRATDFHRASGVMVESFFETHETLSTVLTGGGTGLKRWQRVVVLCTLIMGMLCVASNLLCLYLALLCQFCLPVHPRLPPKLTTFFGLVERHPLSAAPSISGSTGQSPRSAARKSASASSNATPLRACRAGAWVWHQEGLWLLPLLLLAVHPVVNCCKMRVTVT